MIPFRYRNLYAQLDAKLTEFDECIPRNPDDSGAVFSGELLSANGNRGLRLLDPEAQEWMHLELDRLEELGCGGVSIALNFPLLYEPFWTWTGYPHRYRQFVDFYAHLSENIANRHIRLVVDNAVVFTGYYSADSGLDMESYYETLNRQELIEGRAQTATTILEELDPDFLNLGSEPDTQAMILEDESLDTPEGYGDFIHAVLDLIPQGSRRGVPLGAGVGSWKGDGKKYIDALAEAGIDYIDFHVYPVNFACLMDQLVRFVDHAASLGLQSAIGEAWLLKQRNIECTISSTATNPIVFSRDAFSFWAPLDQDFLLSLVRFAHWKQLKYSSGFWTRYFWAYLEYADCRGLNPDQIITRASYMAGEAIKAGETTETGKAYKDAISASSQGEK